MMDKIFKYNNKDKEIFDSELIKYLPTKIIDSHVHLWKKENINVEIITSDRLRRHPFLSVDFLNNFSYLDFVTVSKTIFPRIEYDGLFFGLPFREVDIKKANKMIKDDVISRNKAALFIPIATDKYNYLEKKIKEENFIGLKPYPDLAVGLDCDNQNSVSIFDFLPEEHLKIANKLGLIILLHIPKIKRLNDKKNLDDIINICNSYPNIKLILAHAGRSYCVFDLVDSIKKIYRLKNLYVDTAMINNWKVIELLLEYLGCEKIIYGSDLPVAAFRGKNICINNKHYFITYPPFPWSLSNENLGEGDFTLFLYEEIREILKAVKKKKMDRQVIDNIFYQNIKNLTSSVKV